VDKEIVEQINRTQHKVFIAVAGGGQNFIGDYLAYDGGSNTILGFYVPYKQELFDEFIGGKVDNYASDEAARKLAVASYKKALAIVGEKYAIGIGAASSVASGNERVGRKHRLCIAVQTFNRTKSITYTLVQGRTRQEENELISKTILWFLAVVSGVEMNCPTNEVKLTTGECINYPEQKPNDQIIDLVHGRRRFVSIDNPLKGDRLVLYCGSFNPFHEAHRAICEISEGVIGVRPYVELSVTNTDKPFLDYIEMTRRVNDIRSYGQRPLLTNAPRYIDKVDLFDGKEITFVVGADTWERIWDAKYGVEIPKLVDTFIQKKTRFLVFARDGKTCSNVIDSLPDDGYKIFIQSLVIPSKDADEFALSMSSTEIRKAKQARAS
jgi:hypothetical protein